MAVDGPLFWVPWTGMEPTCRDVPDMVTQNDKVHKCKQLLDAPGSLGQGKDECRRDGLTVKADCGKGFAGRGVYRDAVRRGVIPVPGGPDGGAHVVLRDGRGREEGHDHRHKGDKLG